MRGLLVVGCIVLLVSGPLSFAEEKPPGSAALGWDFQEYKQVTFFRSTFDPAVLAANCEYEHLWNGDFRVVHVDGAKIDWVAKMPPQYDGSGGYLLSLDWIRFEDLGFDALAVVTSTHKGNGRLWLFRLEGRELRILMNTPVVGWADEPTPLKGLPAGRAVFEKELSIKYQSIHSPADPESVTLSGTVIVRHPDLDTVLARKQITEWWTWDEDGRTFHLYPSGIRGLGDVTSGMTNDE